ncbi:MAG: AAA family ATPase [Candidatus Hydrogenedentes bacterium]|nr:AAA family ATPase [Candidatus Hydrogenedentota bacterium]
MEVQEYLREKEKRFEKSVRRLRDVHVFDFNYVPDKPLMRDEIKPIIDAMLRYEKTGIANHMLIIGSRGSGKTLSVKHLKKLFEARGLRVLYSNCRVYNTSYKVMANLLEVRARGVSFDELAERFTDKFQGKTVVVLDEVDLLSEKDKNKDILYFLSRSSQNYMAVLLSNNPKWMNVLDESIRSTLQPELVHFRSYDALELGRILQQRADLGIRGTPKKVVNEISALTARNTNSDVRVAIKTLYYWATEPDMPLVENFQKARRDIIIDVANDLNDKNLLILKASAMARDRRVKEVYETYRRLSVKYKEDPFSYVYFYSALSYLQSLGLVLLISTKVGRTYTNIIHLTFHRDILDAIWELRFIQL